jgi:hypothetical protein
MDGEKTDESILSCYAAYLGISLLTRIRRRVDPDWGVHMLCKKNIERVHECAATGGTMPSVFPRRTSAGWAGPGKPPFRERGLHRGHDDMASTLSCNQCHRRLSEGWRDFALIKACEWAMSSSFGGTLHRMRVYYKISKTLGASWPGCTTIHGA